MSVGLNFGQMFQSNTTAISNKGADLQSKMDTLSNSDAVGAEDLLSLQFEMGQYTALMEATSTITKSITDMLKSLAQRTG